MNKRPDNSIVSLAELLKFPRYETRSREPGYQWGEVTFSIPVRDGHQAQRQIETIQREFAELTTTRTDGTKRKDTDDINL